MGDNPRSRASLSWIPGWPELGEVMANFTWNPIFLFQHIKFDWYTWATSDYIRPYKTHHIGASWNNLRYVELNQKGSWKRRPRKTANYWNPCFLVWNVDAGAVCINGHWTQSLHRQTRPLRNIWSVRNLWKDSELFVNQSVPQHSNNKIKIET